MTETDLMTGHGDIPVSVQAMKAGAVEFLTEPVRNQDRPEAIGQAIECDVWHAGSARIWLSFAVVMTR